MSRRAPVRQTSQSPVATRSAVPRHASRLAWAEQAVLTSVEPSGNNSVVECDLAKVEVAGSNPVSRSNFLPPLLRSSGEPSGVIGAVAKW